MFPTSQSAVSRIMFMTDVVHQSPSAHAFLSVPPSAFHPASKSLCPSGGSPQQHALASLCARFRKQRPRSERSAYFYSFNAFVATAAAAWELVPPLRPPRSRRPLQGLTRGSNSSDGCPVGRTEG